ncbi:MAG: 2-C-methyl-D-erythritol 4-phosphate cytidylyltransferase [Desulfobacteraceae bacterium]|nr:2-C-methyl-D-erythritol 4-phosphate cytidylyltransferase [Desulfobacteraceae bacterium]
MASAIIVAAGCGKRMQSSVAKQFLEIENIPILVRTLRVFAGHPSIGRIRLVVPQEEMEFCRGTILPEFGSEVDLSIVAGGKRRQDSVYQGLLAVAETGQVVVIHDGVRPFVSGELITACIEGAERVGACIVGVPASDTVKRVGGGNMILETIARDEIWLAQTPQAFRYEVIKKAFDKANADGFSGTDDASLVERMGWPVHMIEGSRHNIKITTSADMELAPQLLKIFESIKENSGGDLC